MAGRALLVELNIPLDKAEDFCWACRCHRWLPYHHDLVLERAHIRAHSGGGSDRDPGNFFLLCSVCHRDQPDGVARGVQFEWLRTREYWEDRADRRTRPLIDSLKAAARRAGLPGYAVEYWFFEAGGKLAMERLHAEGHGSQGSIRHESEAATATWGLLESFRHWIGTLPGSDSVLFPVRVLTAKSG